jgi:hypothetical protein
MKEINKNIYTKFDIEYNKYGYSSLEYCRELLNEFSQPTTADEIEKRNIKKMLEII